MFIHYFPPSFSSLGGYTHLYLLIGDEANNSATLREIGASLVAQWLRICLLMQGTWVRALVWEDPTCHGATKPVSHNY